MGKNRPPAARMGIIGARPAGVWRRRRWLTTPDAAFDAEREPRAHGPGFARGDQRRRSTREGAGPTARPFCKSFLLERILLQTGLARRRLAADCFWPSRPTFPPPFPQARGGRVDNIGDRHCPYCAFPADVWRQRSETFIGHRAFRRATTFDARGPWALKTGCRICAPLIHTC